MVSLLVAGVLMATLVGISGTVQRSFGRSKDLIELQANLRLAMYGLVEDISRAAYMYSPNPLQSKDSRTVGILPAQAEQALDFDLSENMLILRGNYISSRDYKLGLEQNEILCRNGMRYDSYCCELYGGQPDRYKFPFGDGPRFGEVFCPGELVRVEEPDGHYSYRLVNNTNPPGLNVTLTPPPVRTTQTQGESLWISPVTTVGYRMVNDPMYVKPYTGGVLEADRWMLQRISDDCRGVIPAEVADFLLPPVSATPGFVIEPYNIDSISGMAAQVCTGEFPFTVDKVPTPIDAANPIEATRLRALAVVLRGRTEMEDPALLVVNPDHSVDLDGNPANGMAHVRVERTMIQLRNMGITYCVQ
jgi:hypothetical protein